MQMIRALALTFILTTPMAAQGTVVESSAIASAIDSTGLTGTILLHDTRQGGYVAGHVERVDRRLIPASTFKIFNSLVALETGVIADSSTIIEWDGIVRQREELNRDLDLQTAFRISAVPHYQELARRIGPERMQHYIDAVGYGNGDISGGIEWFWLTGALRISPREQVEFLARLRRGDLPFAPATMATVREMMVNERSDNHILRAKTGWAILAEGQNVGWWVGWVERDSNAVIFATAFEATTPDISFGPARQAVTRHVLAELGLYPLPEM